jgi:hypothetical protein
MTSYSLTFDDRLVVRAHDATCDDTLSRWLPLNARVIDDAAIRDAAIIVDVVSKQDTVRSIRDDLPARTAIIAGTTLHVAGDEAWIAGTSIAGHVDLAHSRATIAAAHGTDITAAMNFAVALLLARIRRYLMHCGCITHPDYGGLLVVGDSHSGKTTTTISLAHAGWRILSDDHVILWLDADGSPRAEGWPRLMHVDTGWEQRVPTGTREPLDPARFLAARKGRIPQHAALTGVLLPCIDASESASTHASPVQPSVTLENLVRQTAWSIAHPASAPVAFADLAEAARLPAFQVTLARDTFGDPEKLGRLLVLESLRTAHTLPM